MRYYLVGDDADRKYVARLRRDIAALGLERQAIITGLVSRAQLHAYCQLADLFLLTPVNLDRGFEGFGIVYLEAGMFGKPVISSANYRLPRSDSRLVLNIDLVPTILEMLGFQGETGWMHSVASNGARSVWYSRHRFQRPGGRLGRAMVPDVSLEPISPRSSAGSDLLPADSVSRSKREQPDDLSDTRAER